MQNYEGKKVLVRGMDSGVYFGEVIERSGQEVENTIEGLKIIREAIKNEKCFKVSVRIIDTDGNVGKELHKDEAKQYYCSFIDSAIHLLGKLSGV